MKVAFGLALVLTAFGAGWQVRAWRCDAALLKQERAAAKALAKAQAQVEASATSYEQDRSQGYVDTVRRQETVRTIYRDRPVHGSCAVPDDARRVLDDAVASANASASGEPRR